MPIDAGQNRGQALLQVAAELNSSLDLDVVLQKVMDRVIEMTKASRGFIVLVDPVTNRMEVRMARSETGDVSRDFRGSRSVVDNVIRTRTAVVTTDASTDDRFAASQSVMMQNLRSVVAVPLFVRGGVIGALYVDNPFRAGIFGDADRDFLQAIANQAAIAIENARLYTALLANYEHGERLRMIFERYVNKQVTDWVMADPNRDTVFLPGQRMLVTMLASDIAGFSTLSQRLEAEDVVEFLNAFYKRMVDVILQHGGNIDKFQGDGLLVVFGAPVPVEDSAQRAVATARAMRREVAAFNRERGLRGEAPIEVGIGIDTGFVVAGNIGSERRLEYTLIGVPVNNAAYLSKMRPASVLITEGTHRALGGAVEVAPHDQIVLKGASTPSPIYSVTN